MTQVLDKGFVELKGHMGGDLSVINGAKVSFAKQVEEVDEAGEGIIRYMMKNKHGSPFEHNAFTFHIKCPIFVAREWMRHRIGSFNEWSGRYSEFEPEFYIPNTEDVRTSVAGSKPGHYAYKPASTPVAESFKSTLNLECNSMFTFYKAVLEMGVAKEQARFLLPVNIYTQFWWTVNARSLMNFLSLRTHETAMWEIQRYAEVVQNFFYDFMPVTHDAWVHNKKVAP